MSNEMWFVDIMEERRRKCDVFTFMSNTWSPQKTFQLEKNFTPQNIKDFVANSSYIDAFLEAESARTGVRKEKLKHEVVLYLDEMGMDKKVPTVRWMGILFLKIAIKMKIHVFVNETAILNLKSSMGKNPVLFLPTHRSYADFCLLTYLCYHYGIDFPAVAAGMDFYHMAILGRAMRETGAYYIRRTLAGSSVYAATLRHYVRTVVAKHSAPIEFFIEGTRSRSNKCLPPKYGMLSMALMPLFAGEVSDITIVPINISYDRLMEQSLFAYEHLGIPKPKESTGGFIKALRKLSDNFGNIYINFGAPISIREHLNIPILSKQTLNPSDLQQLTSDQFTLVQEIADDIVGLLQKNTIITITSLLALVISQYMFKNQPIEYQSLIQEVDWIIKQLELLGANVFENDAKKCILRMVLVHNKLVRFGKDAVLHLICDPPINLTSCVKARMKGHVLKSETMTNALPIIQLQLYINPVLHYLVPPAIVYRLVMSRTMDREQLAYNYNKIRMLLKHEFFYSEKNEQMLLENTISYSLENDVIIAKDDVLVPGCNDKVQYLLSSSIWPSLALMSKCIEQMMQLEKADLKTALKNIQASVECSSPQCHPYCLSLEATTNCLQGLVSVAALKRDKTQENCVFEVVTEVMEDCRLLISSVLPYFNVDFSTNNPVIMNEPMPCRL